MLISNNFGLINTNKFVKAYSDKDIDFYINGIIFCRKKKEGIESIQYIIQCLKEKSEIPFKELFGTYTVVIDIHSEKQIVFSDNSCMHGFFISDNYIGSNYIEIINAEGANKIDKIGACEYLCLIRGGLSKHTLVEGIAYSDNEEYYIVKKGKRTKHNKRIGSIDCKSDISNPIEFFRDVMYALDNKKLICALTGGFDSRAVASIINSISATDCFVSGDNEKASEIVLAKKAAMAGGYVMKHIKPHYPEINNDTIMEKWKSKGGYHVSFGFAEFRVDDFMDRFKTEHYEVLLDGSAGDMHKEFWFTQEFPLYGRKKSNPSRFYQKRMKQYSPILGEEICSSIENMEKIQLQELKKLSKKNNCQSCLLYGWYNDWYSMSARNTECAYPIVYSPLQEIEMVRYSYCMDSKGKFMNMFLRKLTSESNIEVARIKTVYGTTASDEPIYLIRDFFFQFLRYGQLLLSYLSRELTGKRLFLPNVDSMSTDSDIKKTKTAVDAISWAKSKGYLIKEVDEKDIPMYIFDAIVNLFLIEKSFKD